MSNAYPPLLASLATRASDDGLGAALANDPIREVDRAIRAVLMGLGRGENQRNQGDGAVFVERLLSLRQAESIRPGTAEVRIAPGTVVTPLARDFLKRQGIALRFAARGEIEAQRPKGEWGFAAEADSGIIAAWRRVLLDEDWQDLPGPAERWVAEGSDRGALLVTEGSALAVWRACQVRGVRAATAADPDSVARAVRSLGVNLLVIEPAGKPIALLRQMARAFRRSGAPRLPDALKAEVSG